MFLPLAARSTPELTLDDLRKLEIICFVPSYLPKGFRLQRVDITYDDAGPDEPKRQFPLYSVVYSDDPRNGATFSIESAREGIGDRNLMADEENAEETEIKSSLGPMYLIYRPKGKNGRKDEVKANWVSDANMNEETAKGPGSHPILGRFHGFSATGITLAEFTKIVQSLHPIRGDKAPATRANAGVMSAADASSLKIHPKVFNLVDSWISDSESPVVTEINLDAVERNANQFDEDGLKRDGDWLSYALPDSGGFMRYRVVESKDKHYKIEYQENGGGTLTTSVTVEFDIEQRNIRRDGKLITIRVLRVTSYNAK
jgi:hypothetical protein